MTCDNALNVSPLYRITAMVLISSILFASEKSYATKTSNAVITLSAKYTELNKQLLNNQFQRELYLVSTESSHNLKGEIYAVVDYPFATVNQALNNPDHWCDTLILHVNIKYCYASGDKINPVLKVNLGKKDAQPLADAYRVEFKYHELNSAPDYFGIELSAQNGPLSTHDYRIWVEATPLNDGRTFLHLSLIHI